MTETGDDFRQNGIRNRLAIGDDAIEIEDQCAHYCDSREGPGSAFLACAPARVGHAEAKAVEHILLRCVSIGWLQAVAAARQEIIEAPARTARRWWKPS